MYLVDVPRPARSAIENAKRRLSAEFGDSQLLTDPDLLARYGEDYSFAGQFMPDMVVKASSVLEIQRVFQIATDLSVPVTPRGLGSGKSGGALPIAGGIVLSLEHMNRMKEVSREDMLAVAEPGIVTADFMTAAEAEGLFYPPDPNSLKICSLGGNVACNAGGPRALKYGVTRNYVLGLEVVLPTGEVLRLGRRTIKGVTGYDLVGMFVGSEGTLGVITEITCRLISEPKALQTALVSFPDLQSASRAITSVLTAGIVPRTLEFLDRPALEAIRKKTPGRFPENAGALLILETDGGNEERAMEDLERAASLCLDCGAIDVLVAQDAAQRERIWEPRRVLSMTLAETAPRKISEDVVVPRSRIPELLEEVLRIGERHKVRVATYGHAGDGNIHVNILFDHDSETQAHQAAGDVMETAVRLEGTISGEHGVGLTKRGYIGLEQSSELIMLQKRLKAVFDPAGILNPGKIFQGEASVSRDYTTEVPLAALEELPLFPLPGTLLLPHTMISLHVFEPRYRQMVEQTADRNRLLAIAMLDDKAEPDEFGRPPIFAIAGLGAIRRCARLPDGRYNILVEGMGRVDVHEELPPSPTKSFRRARAVRVPDVVPSDSTELDSAVIGLRALCSRVVAQMGRADNELMRRLNALEDPGTLADAVAAATLQDPRERQQVLAECDVLKRVELATGALGAMFLRAQESADLPPTSWGTGPGKA